MEAGRLGKFEAAHERSSVQLRGRIAAQTSASGKAPARVLQCVACKGYTPAVQHHMSCSQRLT